MMRSFAAEFTTIIKPKHAPAAGILPGAMAWASCPAARGAIFERKHPANQASFNIRPVIQVELRVIPY